VIDRYPSPMARLEVKRQMGRGDIQAVSELLDAATSADGHRPLGDHQWLDLVRGGRKGFAGLVAWEPGHGHPVGYAQLTKDHPAPSATEASSWALEYVVDPHHRRRDPDIATTLIHAAIAIVTDEGGGHLHMWIHHPDATHDAAAVGAGFRRGRELHQLRRTLPIAGGESPTKVGSSAATLSVRPFVVGQDEGAWLEVNNRAFAWHVEQGGWTLDHLRTREAQSWFDPAGLLLHEREGKLAGFCWTKIHHDHRPPLGEIYVLAVDPAFQRLRLGRRLMVAGLEWLAGAGLTTAMLYVDADNSAARALYAQLGFTLDHVDQAYVCDIRSSPSQPGR